MGIKSKLCIVMAVVCIIPLFIQYLFFNSILNSQINSAIHERNQRTSTILTNQINFYFSRLDSLVENFSKVDCINDEHTEDLDEVNTTLSKLIKQDSSILSAFIMDNDSKIVATTDKSRLNQDFDRESYGFTDGYRISFFTQEEIDGDNTIVFYVSSPIYDDNNRTIGTMLIKCNTNYIKNILDDSILQDDLRVFFIDYKGEYLQSPFNKLNTTLDSPMTLEDIRNISSNEELTGELTDFPIDENASCSYIDIPNSSFKIMYLPITSEVSLFKNNIISLLYTLAFVGTLFVIILILSSVITSPIKKIVLALEQKRKGNSDVSINLNSNDELGFISHEFDKIFFDVSESEHRYRSIVEMTDNIVFEVNMEAKTVFISNNFNSKYSFRPYDDSFNESFFMKGRIHKDDYDRYHKDLSDFLTNEIENTKGEYRFKNIYGDFGWILIRASKFYNRKGKLTKIIGVIVDIDRAKKSELNLLQRASYDSLTHLYNRETYVKSLSKAIEVAKNKSTRVAVMFVDIDDFKFYNDEYGHAVGDEVLKFIADAIKEVCFEKGFGGRYGGDEFIITLFDVRSKSYCENTAKELLDILNEGFDYNNIHLDVKCSIGISIYPYNGITCDEVITAADDAMYQIKKNGKCGYDFSTIRYDKKDKG